MNNATYAQILASWAERRKNLYHFSLFLLYFFVAYVLIRACWPGEDHMYYDAGWYWSVISSSDLDNAPKMYRGYLYPYILFLLKTCSVDLDIPAERLFILVNSAAISIFIVYLIPGILCIKSVAGGRQGQMSE